MHKTRRTCCLSKNEWNLWLPFIQLLTALNLQKNISFVGILHIILQLQQEQHNASAVNRETRWWWWCLQGWIRHACKENHQHPVQDFLRMSMKCPVPVATSYRYYYFLQTHLSKWIPTLNFCYCSSTKCCYFLGFIEKRLLSFICLHLLLLVEMCFRNICVHIKIFSQFQKRSKVLENL